MVKLHRLQQGLQITPVLSHHIKTEQQLALQALTLSLIFPVTPKFAITLRQQKVILRHNTHIAKR